MDNKERFAEASTEVFVLKVIADALKTDAETVARVLSNLSDEDVEFVVESLANGEDEATVLRAVQIFQMKLEELS